MDDFRQQVAKFVSNVSNLLFSQVAYLRNRQTQASSGNVEKYIAGLDRLCATTFLTLLHPSLGFDPYFGNHWASKYTTVFTLCVD